jgi:ankyrin repeat protein
MDYFEDGLYDTIINSKCDTFRDYIRKGLDVNHAFRSTNGPDRLNRLGKTVLEVAVNEGQADIAKILVETTRCNASLLYVVDVNQYGYFIREYTKKNRLKLTCMFPCIVKGEVDMIRLLVQAGYDVNVYDDRGCTALWHAVDLDNYEMVKAMVKANGCDVNVTDHAKLRPLHVAAMRGNPRVMSRLIRCGAAVDVPQLRGSTALILTCRTGCYDSARLLILNGADPNHVGRNGHFPLSTALQWSSDRRLPELLLEAGAKVGLELIQKCREEKLNLFKENPDLFLLLKDLSEEPRSLKTVCQLVIRKCLVQSNPNLHLLKKVDQLPLPRLIKDYLLLWNL